LRADVRNRGDCRRSLAATGTADGTTCRNEEGAMQRAAQITHVLLRVVSGFFFMQHGGMKLFGWYGGIGLPEGASLPPLMLVAGILEVFGGLAIVLGLFTRPVAFLLSGEMAVAYFMSHLPKGLLPLDNGGEPAALFCFIFLFLAAHGSGGFSVDDMMKRGRSAKA
jgi:putative oxidoreductase